MPLRLSDRAVAEALDGLPAHKIHGSVLAEEAIKAAVKDYYDRAGIVYGPELETDNTRLRRLPGALRLNRPKPLRRNAPQGLSARRAGGGQLGRVFFHQWVRRK